MQVLIILPAIALGSALAVLVNRQLMGKCKVLLIGLALALGATATAAILAGCATMPSAKAGDVLYVSVRHLPVHQRPTGYSAVVGMLNFGAETSIVEGTPEGDVPGWAGVRSGGVSGYVPASALVSQHMLERQDPKGALAKSKTGAANVAGKGFSETEEGDLTAVKGLGGSKVAGNGADYAAMDAILAQPVEYNPKDAYAAFRQEGKLGEFAVRK